MRTRFFGGRARVYLLLLVVVLGGGMYWQTLTPTHEGEWTRVQQRLPGVQLVSDSRGEFYQVKNFRDFRYDEDGAVAVENYLDKEYAPADLRRVWFGISHFGGYGFAHTFLSFEFADDDFLVLSIEARLRPTQSYDPFLGLVRQYHKIIVLGSESDIIGLRTHSRGERVLLYPLQLQPAQAEFLLRALMDDVQQLAAQPEFYNTLLDNCATGLLKHTPDYRVYSPLLDYRLMLPGYSDAVVQEKGWIDTRVPLTELRALAQIDVTLTLPAADDFSQAIRHGWTVAEEN